jgi:hypothetical protein
MKKKSNKRKQEKRLKSISLYPLEPEEALENLLQIKPRSDRKNIGQKKK